MQTHARLIVLLALLGPALAGMAGMGDNGLTTYTGRKREPNTLVFGNDMVSEQALQATLNIMKDVMKGSWKPTRNDPATEKAEVRWWHASDICLLQAHEDGHASTAICSHEAKSTKHPEGSGGTATSLHLTNLPVCSGMAERGMP